MTPEYTCDCDLEPGEARTACKVTGHDGSVTICAYCPDCFELALVDWNGETASVEVVPDGYVPSVSIRVRMTS